MSAKIDTKAFAGAKHAAKTIPKPNFKSNEKEKIDIQSAVESLQIYSGKLLTFFFSWPIFVLSYLRSIS